MEDLTSLLVGGIPLIIVIFGLVEFSKKLGLSGNWLLAFSLALGTFFGIAYKLSLAMPAGLADWFAVIIFGLALGLIASGIYDFASSRMPQVGP
jgi:hypothetical protein